MILCFGQTVFFFNVRLSDLKNFVGNRKLSFSRKLRLKRKKKMAIAK